jgi:hypothetical protein
MQLNYLILILHLVTLFTGFSIKSYFLVSIFLTHLTSGMD